MTPLPLYTLLFLLLSLSAFSQQDETAEKVSDPAKIQPAENKEKPKKKIE